MITHRSGVGTTGPFGQVEQYRPVPGPHNGLVHECAAGCRGLIHDSLPMWTGCGRAPLSVRGRPARCSLSAQCDGRLAMVCAGRTGSRFPASADGNERTPARRITGVFAQRTGFGRATWVRVSTTFMAIPRTQRADPHPRPLRTGGCAPTAQDPEPALPIAHLAGAAAARTGGTRRRPRAALSRGRRGTRSRPPGASAACRRSVRDPGRIAAPAARDRPRHTRSHRDARDDCDREHDRKPGGEDEELRDVHTGQ